MKRVDPESFAAKLKALREAAGFTQDELATIAGLSIHAVSALERGERRRPHVETVRALSAALDLSGVSRDAFVASARAPMADAAVDELTGRSLPRPLTAILGRESDVQTLLQWLTVRATRLVTIVGPGGVGKTRLALEVARASLERGESGVVFVSLASVPDAAFVASAVAEAHGLTDVSALDLGKHMQAAYGDRPTLLVLDNFEHVLDAAPLVADLLGTVASLQVLATSRAPLHLRGEREYSLGPLPLDGGSELLPPPDLAAVPAARLFVERVRDVQPAFRLTVANSATVAAICRQLDGLPLAIELTAPWIKVLPPEELLHRLRHDPLLEAVGPRDLPERQQTINATVAWSYRLLDPAGQRAFRRLGALPAAFSIDAADAVLAGPAAASTTANNTLIAVRSLIDKSLLLRAESSIDPTRPRYRMLETVRAYAKSELARSGELTEAHEGLARHCVVDASRAEAELVGPDQSEWLDRTRADLESHRAALAWLIERDRPAEAASIAWGLLWFWVIRGHAREGLHWYERILTLPSLAPAMEARTLIGLGLMRYVQVDLDRARADLTRAATVARSVSDDAIVAQADVTLGHVEHMAGNLGAARECFLRTSDSPGARAIPWVVGSALTGLAWVAIERGDADDEATRLLDAAAAALREAGPWFPLLVEFLRCTIAVRRHEADEVFSSALESLQRIRELRDQFAFVYTLAMLAAAAALKGETAWVARILGARDSVSTRTDAGVVDGYLADLLGTIQRDAQVRLGPAAWAQAYAAGRRVSIDDLIEDINRALSNAT